MFPDSVLLSLTGCEDGDRGRLVISHLNLPRKALYFFFLKKVETAFAYSKIICKKYSLSLLVLVCT